jgi:hypothetical protein
VDGSARITVAGVTPIVTRMADKELRLRMPVAFSVNVSPPGARNGYGQEDARCDACHLDYDARDTLTSPVHRGQPRRRLVRCHKIDLRG